MITRISYSIIVSLLLISNTTFSQRTTTNPIIYAEVSIGGAVGKTPGLFFGEEINYQFKNNLFTVRASATLESNVTIVPIVFLPFPVFEQKTTSGELALLYGYRTISKGHSYSFSLGVSINDFRQNRLDANNTKFQFQTNYVGVPYEFNIKWFKRKKEPLTIFYGLIPIGNPTAFGSSIGFKLGGNISKNSYCALGITVGFGWHKQY